MENNKLTNYIEKFAGHDEIIDSPRSRYYKFNGNVLRVSDHIGQTSSGSMSIIKTNCPNYYVIHRHSDGTIMIMTYEEVKSIVKAFSLFSKVFIDKSGINNFEIQKNTIDVINQAENLKDANNENNDFILGIHKSRFSTGQLGQIISFVKQVNQNK